MPNPQVLPMMTRRLLMLLGALLLTGRAWALKPDRVYHQLPDSLGLAYTAADVSTADGYRLKTWFFEPEATKARHVTVVLAYQDFGNMSYYLHQVNALHRAGYHVVTFDYRGFGQSADFTLNPAQLYYPEFAEELRAVVGAARARWARQPLGVLALSMGTIPATMVAAGRQLDFLVAEGFVTDPQQIVRSVKQAKNKDVLLPAAAADFPARLRRIKCPLLVFAGAQDTFTPLADSRQLVAQGRRRELVEFAGGHLGGFGALSPQPLSYATFGDGYVARISSFLASARVSRP
jgi:alpha-beta hydrolase superfamily lysophospholipase